MLKKSFAFGLLAAVMVAPTAALADQVAGSTTVTNQSSVNRGYNNTSGQSSVTNTIQSQVHRAGSAFCNGSDPGSQTAAASSITNQDSNNRGYNNVSGNSSITNTIQHQVAHKVGGYFCGY